MNHALVLSVFSSTFLVLTTLSGATGDPKPQPSNREQDISYVQAQQPYDFVPGYLEGGKRSWKDLQSGWGKRGWKDLQTGAWGKRGWSDLQGAGWGKRSWHDRSWEDPENWYYKRAWNDLRGGSWGKRDMDQYQGGWDRKFDDQLSDMNDEFDGDGSLNKRDPGWQQLKGLWGKKTDKQWSRLGAMWG